MAIAWHAPTTTDRILNFGPLARTLSPVPTN